MVAARSGGVLFVHRFGATMNAHVHLHLFTLDGVVAQRRAAGLDAGADWVVDPVPAYVERDLRKFLECGILAHGFVGAESVIPRALTTTERMLACAQCIRGKPGAAPAFSPAR